MKKHLLATFLMLPTFWVGAAWGSTGEPGPDMRKADTFPWLENFNSEVFPPEGWTEIQIEGTSSWTTETSNYGMGGKTDGMVAYHNYASGMQHTALVSPAIAIPSGDNSYELFFWSNMGSAFSFYGEDELSAIYVSTTPASDADAFLANFEELYTVPVDTALENRNMNAFQYGPVPLDEYKGQTVYLALVYKGDNAHKWFVDDVEIRELAPSGTFSGSEHLDMGIVFNNADVTIWKEYRVTIRGRKIWKSRQQLQQRTVLWWIVFFLCL